MNTIKEESIDTTINNKVEEESSISEIVLKASIALSAGTLAFLSRAVFEEDVARIVGSYETKALIDHFLTGITFSAGLSEPRIKRGVDITNDNAPAIGYALFCTFWEFNQFYDRGWLQYGQLLADYAGCAVGPMLTFLKEKK